MLIPALIPERPLTGHDFSGADRANQITVALALWDVFHTDCSRLQAFSTSS
jgi:hypothetical protein